MWRRWSISFVEPDTVDVLSSLRPERLIARPKVAVVLFNLGGPDNQEAVRPFLLNLFADPAILRVPPFIRPFLARYIAARRVAPATENYAYIGGRPPPPDP